MFTGVCKIFLKVCMGYSYCGDYIGVFLSPIALKFLYSWNIEDKTEKS